MKEKEILTKKPANVLILSEKKEEKLIALLAEIIVEKTIKKLDYEKSNYIFKNIYRQAK